MSIQQVFDGLATGAIYGMLALALVLIFRSTGVLNFGQGEMATFTTFIGWTIIVQLGVPYWLGAIATLLIAFGIGVAVERIAIRPAARLEHVSVLMITLGLYLLFNALTHQFWDPVARPFPTPFPSGTLEVAGARISWASVGILAVAGLVVALLAALFRYTKTGLAMRAVVSNPTASTLMGIRNGRILSLGWGLSTVVGAVAGLLAANLLLLDNHMMGAPLLFAVTAMVLAGMTSPGGAVVCGLLMGIITAGASGVSFIGTELATVTTFVAIVLILLVRPAGLFGRRTAVKV